MADESDYSHKISCVEDGQRQETYEFPLLTRTLGERNQDEESYIGQCQSYEPSYGQDLKQAVCILEQKSKYIEEPHVVEHAVVQYVLGVAHEIQEIAVLSGYEQYVTVFAYAEPYE